MRKKSVDIKSKAAIEKKAPRGQFRVIGVNTDDPYEWLVGDYPNLASAVKVAESKVAGTHMIQMHVYDDNGQHRDSKLGWRDDFDLELEKNQRVGQGQFAPMGRDLMMRLQNRHVDPRYAN